MKPSKPITPRKKIELASFCSELCRHQYATRTSGRPQAVAKMHKKRHAARVRKPKVADTKVLDFTDTTDGKRYFRLDNGQIVSPDNLHRVRESGKLRLGNPALRDVVLASVTKTLPVPTAVAV